MEERLFEHRSRGEQGRQAMPGGLPGRPGEDRASPAVHDARPADMPTLYAAPLAAWLQ